MTLCRSEGLDLVQNVWSTPTVCYYNSYLNYYSFITKMYFLDRKCIMSGRTIIYSSTRWQVAMKTKKMRIRAVEDLCVAFFNSCEFISAVFNKNKRKKDFWGYCVITSSASINKPVQYKLHLPRKKKILERSLKCKRLCLCAYCHLLY